MAIKRLDDVFPAHMRRVTLFAVAMEIVVLVMLTVLLTWLGIDLLSIIVFILLPVSVLHIFAMVVISKYALGPLDFLTRAITQVSGQPHDTKPPNLNGTYHERTGFSLMVNTVYGLATRESSAKPDDGVNSLQAALLEKLPGGVIALDESRKIIYANPSAPMVVNSNGEQVLQLMFDDNDTFDSWIDDVESSQVSAAKTWRRVQTSLPGDNDRRVFDVVASYQKGGAQGVETLLLCFDQTKYYSVNEDSMDFIALAAHELRGPITVIRGYLDILRPELDSALTDDQKQLFDRLDVSASKLSGYVSNVLNASKYDRRHLKLHLHEDRLEDVYKLVADDLTLRATTQGRVLSVTIPDNLPSIAADRNSLSEVIANLVDNAIKYSKEGGQIAVTAGVEGSMVKFSVQDFGVGMPSAVVGNLFNKFYRSHRSKGTVSGTGLGLYISKAIVESHGGHMSLSSTEGEGSTFTFSVPIYSTVKDKLLADNAENQGIIETSSGWIKNHSMYRG